MMLMINSKKSNYIGTHINTELEHEKIKITSKERHNKMRGSAKRKF